MINLGTSTMQDFALGDNLVERIDLGDTTIFDPYTTITGTLPLTFNSRAAVALKNYRIHGTSEGAGVETENLAPPLSKWEDGYISANGWIGSASATNKERYSPKIPVEPNAIYQWAYETGRFPSGANGPWSGLGWYDDNDSFISRNSGVIYTDLEVVAPSNAAYARLSFRTYDEEYNTMFIKSTATPETYIPYGYKIPISNMSGEQQSNYDLFVGDSKLYEDEYMDYGEQKMYKRTENLFNKNAKDTDNGYVRWHAIISTGAVAQDSSWDVTEYINVKPSTVYTASNCVGVGASICFYDTNKEYISGIPYNLPKPGEYGTLTFTTPNNCAYARTCVLTVNQSGSGYEFERNVDVFMITEGSTVPASYIPYLQPTDQPIPLPPINTYEGENTLSSTETLGEVSVKGRISASDSTP